MNAQTLTEKYRPKALAEIAGNEKIVRLLRGFIAEPTSKAFLLDGPPGCGKTSTAYAIANELGVDVPKREWGGLHEIASGEMTAETVRELFRTTLQYCSWHGSGWKVVIANEADNMSDKAAFIWLDVSEHLPKRTVIIFTTNEAGKLPSRFRQRCECHTFKAAVAQYGEKQSPAELAAQHLIDRVWLAELGHNHAPMLVELDNVSEGGQLSYRSVIQGLEPLIRAQRMEDKTNGESAHSADTTPPAVPAAAAALFNELADAQNSLAAIFARKAAAI